MESLGALTQGDRKGTIGAQTASMETFNINNKLDTLLECTIILLLWIVLS